MNKKFFVCAVAAAALLALGGCQWLKDDHKITAREKSPSATIAPAADPAAKWRQLDGKLYPDADTILLRDNETVTVNSDGTAERRDESWTFVKTAAGRDEFNSFTLHFNEFYQKMPEISVEIIKPSGQVITPELQKKLSVESSQMQANIYDPANKVLSVGIPNVEVGDIIHVVCNLKTIRPRIQNVWCDIALLQLNAPVLEYVYTVSVPESFPLQSIALKDEVKGTLQSTQERRNGRIFYKFAARNVPQIVPEPDMPPWYLHCMRVLCSTAKGWQEISRWYYNLCEKRLAAVSPELTNHARTLAAGKTPDAAVRALFDYVSKEIRYTGVTNEDTAPGYEPHDVKDTFAQKHGVCRDKAALLAAMLREAGFDAFMVLFMAGDPKDPEIPNNYFNHAITGVRMENGELVLMDPTDENSSDMLPAYAMDKSFLCATAQGDILRRTAVVPPEKNMLKIKSQGRIDENYTLHWQSDLVFEGINDNIYRGAFAQWEQDYRREFVASALKKALPGAVLEKLEVLPEDVRDLSQPFRLHLQCKVENFAELKFGSGVLNMPFLSSAFGALNFMPGDGLAAERRFPLHFFSTAGVSEEFTLELPENMQLAALPEKQHINSGFLRGFIGTERLSDGRLAGKKEIKLNKVEITPAEYPVFRQAMLQLKSSAHSGKAVVKKLLRQFTANDKANAVVENKSVKLEYTALDSWVLQYDITLKILNYGGVKEYSELVLDYVEGLSKAEFLHGTVKLPDGRELKIDPAQIKVMDSPVSAAAPRYPALKKLIVPLPGVVPGSVINYSWQLKKSRAAHQDHWFVLPEMIPVKNKSLEISYPERLHKKFKTLLPQSGFAVETEKSNGRRVVKVTAGQLDAIPMEIAAAPHWLYLPSAAVSNLDLTSYSEQLKKALEKAAGNQQESSLLAQKLVQNCTGEMEKIKAIRDYVARNIRRAGADLSVLGMNHITPADVTLREGYGNSADQAVLLYAMLKSVGIKPQWYLAANVPFLPQVCNQFKLLPRNLFSEVLLFVESAEGDLLLNDTDEYAAIGTIAGEGKLGLDLAAGELKLLTASAEFQNSVRREWQIKCLPDQSAEISCTVFYYGMDHARMKRFFDRITPENERQYWAKQCSGVLSGGVTSQIKKDFSAYPGEVSFAVKVPRFWHRSGNFAMLELPASGMENVIRTAGKRTAPYWFNNSAEISNSYTVDVPDSWQSCEFDGGNFALGLPGCEVSAIMKSSYDPDRRLQVNESLQLKPFYCDSSAAGSLENMQKQLSSPVNRTFLFKTTGK